MGYNQSKILFFPSHCAFKYISLREDFSFPHSVPPSESPETREAGIASPLTSCSHTAPPQPLHSWFTEVQAFTNSLCWGSLTSWQKPVGQDLFHTDHWLIFLPWVPYVGLGIHVPLTCGWRGAHLLPSTTMAALLSLSLFPAALG